MAVQDYVISLLDFDEQAANKFYEWAFGNFDDPLTAIDRVYEWNKRHGDLLLLKREDVIMESLDKMVEIYKKALL
jgi:hypothetical protein